MSQMCASLQTCKKTTTQKCSDPSAVKVGQLYMYFGGSKYTRIWLRFFRILI